ncbi:MAG: DUF2953 domain-containing protein [Lachnospiraceae bacterium]|nr:DUF2953 domain-containing protein [Lachnospiraceae bacterium]
MLHILLLILKIIGILLLCVLGVLVLGIVCALFVPVRYRIEVVRKEGAEEPPVAATVKITWLFHFVNVLVCFAGSLSVRARLMLFTVFRLPKRKRRRGSAKADEPGNGKDSEAGKRRKTEKLPTAREAESGGTGDSTGDERKNEEIRTAEETVSSGVTKGDEKGTAQAVDGETTVEPGKKPAWWEKLRSIPKILRGIFEKIRSIFENIQYTIQNICDKIRSISDTIEYYRGVIEGETFQRSFALCKKELLTIAKSLKPDRFETALVIGTDDPATTGKILAVCGMLYPVFGPQVNVAGDFERKRLEGRVFIKGKLRFFTFVRVAVKIYFNKDIRKLYGLLKKEAV